MTSSIAARADTRPREKPRDIPREGEWIDLSVPIRDGMVHWPDNPAVGVTCDERELEGNAGVCRVSTLSFGAHTGTHIDAPVHFAVSPTGVDALPLETFIGVARVIEIQDRAAITPRELEVWDVEPAERLLFKTCNSGRCWRMEVFTADYVYVTPAAAKWLVDRRVRVLGVDYLSVGGMEDGHLTHRALLEGGVSILEGLDLSAVGAGYYDLIALPLRLQGADGAPARAIVRPIS